MLHNLFSSESVVREDKRPLNAIAHLCRQVSSLFSFPEHCSCACWKIRDNKYILSVKRFSGNWVNNILSPSADRLYNKHRTDLDYRLQFGSLLGSYFIQSYTEKFGLRDEGPDFYSGGAWFESRSECLIYRMRVFMVLFSPSRRMPR
jgi:hypothetical protein